MVVGSNLYDAVSGKLKRANDEAVSPVIAVILMVAITVVLAATVYVWVSGFATEDSGPEQASATAKGIDLNDNGDVDWIRVSLTKGNNAPYNMTDVTFSATGPDGSDVLDNNGTAVGPCKKAKTGGSNYYCVGTFSGDWSVGQALYIVCQGSTTSSGNHAITISVKQTTILDTTVKCEERSAMVT